jgi:hypothetical protein
MPRRQGRAHDAKPNLAQRTPPRRSCRPLEKPTATSLATRRNNDSLAKPPQHLPGAPTWRQSQSEPILPVATKPAGLPGPLAAGPSAWTTPGARQDRPWPSLLGSRPFHSNGPEAQRDRPAPIAWRRAQRLRIPRGSDASGSVAGTIFFYWQNPLGRLWWVRMVFCSPIHLRKTIVFSAA